MKEIKNMLEISYEVICCSFKAVLLAILIFAFPLWIIPYAIIKRFKK